jgi:hypothetical protein
MRVIWTSWAHVWRLRSLFLGTGHDIRKGNLRKWRSTFDALLRNPRCAVVRFLPLILIGSNGKSCTLFLSKKVLSFWMCEQGRCLMFCACNTAMSIFISFALCCAPWCACLYFCLILLCVRIHLLRTVFWRPPSSAYRFVCCVLTRRLWAGDCRWSIMCKSLAGHSILLVSSIRLPYACFA